MNKQFGREPMTNNDEGSAPGQSSGGPPVGQPSMGRPMAQAFVPMAEETHPGPSKVLIGIAASGLVLLAFGIVRSMLAEAKPDKPSQAIGSAPRMGYFQQQQQMAREAMDMAREAQQMQRERMDMMRRAEMGVEYGAFDADFGLGGTP